VLSRVDSPAAQVEYACYRSLATRFGENAITQSIGGEQEYLRLQMAYGNRHGSSISNRLDAQSIDRLIARTGEIARSSPEDPEYMPPPGPQAYPQVPPRFYEDAARIEPEDIARTIGATVDAAVNDGFRASGLFETEHGVQAIASSRGLFAFDRASSVGYSTTLHGPAGSGFCSRQCESAAALDAAMVTQTARATALAAQNPRPVDAGDYTVVFEPQAVSDFLGFLFWNMDARDADEGTSVFAGMTGRRLFNEKVTIATRLDDPDLPAAPFGQDGLPLRETVWIDRGTVRRLRHDRYWASRKGTEPDAGLFPLFMDGTGCTVEDLVAGCSRGLLVKRLWYIRYVDRRQLLLTGMTRDGLFRIENGRVDGPVTNLRFNESPVVFLKNITALSRPERVGRFKVPGIVSEEFTFSSGTESL
jgi:predicted Zn-dependent protease